MLLFAIFLAFFRLLILADPSPPKLAEISFKKLLDICTKLENSNSELCQHFISTRPWLYDDVHLVFQKVIEKDGTSGSPAENILEARLIHLIENPKFNSRSLGLNLTYCSKTIKQNHESLAIAIWPHLEKYNNDSYDLQLQVCSNNMAAIIEMKMLQLLKQMVTDRPNCLIEVRNPITMALYKGCDLDIINFLIDQGVEITMHDLVYLHWRSKETFTGAIRKHPYSLLLKSISEIYEFSSIDIWESLKGEKNYSNVLLQICSETIIHAVNNNMINLVKTMNKDFPECILSKGGILMEIAIRFGMNLADLTSFLNEHRLEITPGLVLSGARRSTDSGYRDMILLLNDAGVKITPGQLQHLSNYDNTLTFEWARLNSQLSKETFINSPIKNDFFKRVIDQKRYDLCKKIVEFNVFDLLDIKGFNCLELLPDQESG